MSSTRIAKDDSEFHQSRFASSPEFERGLIANLVAKRCAIINNKADRELIWFVQYLSHQDGGLTAIAKDLLEKFSNRLGTHAMVEIKNRKLNNCNAAQVREIRTEIPRLFRERFRLRGETEAETERSGLAKQAAHARFLCDLRESIDYESLITHNEAAKEAREKRERQESIKYPVSYPITAFQEICRAAAINGDVHEIEYNSLEKELCCLCLDPGYDLCVSPWYFFDLINTLREFHQQWIQEKSKCVVTALGKKVCDALDYTLHSHSLSLLEGEARLGKSFAAREWCVQHAGNARFIEVPPGNDEASFFRALARGLGLGNFLSYKVVEIRARVESVLLTGNLLVVLDEAQRLWPQRNLRYGFPGRIEWVMTMANARVPICMISTPQFASTQKMLEKNGWNAAQLTGRIGHYEFLPTELSESDLSAVGHAALPEANAKTLKALALYARSSARYLAAIDSIVKRARYLSQRAGRLECSCEDIRTAMKESVIPSDTMLLRTLESAKHPFRKQRSFPKMICENPPEPNFSDAVPARQTNFSETEAITA